jgi:exodeoxyribonuclease VII small subunit
MNQPSYAEARKELSAIMKELESPALDVDALDIKVARAASLIRFCRQRIYQVRLKLDKVVLDLEKETSETNTSPVQAERTEEEEIPF